MTKEIKLYLTMTNCIIFASGNGSNAIQLIHHFSKLHLIKIAAVFCNNRNAGIIEKANSLNIPVEVFNKQQFNDELFITNLLKKHHAHYLILAGFLLKIPEVLVDLFPNKIINIHPSLLPKYGGKGMYGMHVHQAVYDNKEKQTGITIHYVNKEYDKGAIIAQYTIELISSDSPMEISKKVQQLEHAHFASTVEATIVGSLN